MVNLGSVGSARSARLGSVNLVRCVGRCGLARPVGLALFVWFGLVGSVRLGPVRFDSTRFDSVRFRKLAFPVRFDLGLDAVGRFRFSAGAARFGSRAPCIYIYLHWIIHIIYIYTPTTLIKKQWHLTEQCGVSYLFSCISFQLYIFLFGVSYLVSVVFFGFLVFLVGWGGGYIKE